MEPHRGAASGGHPGAVGPGAATRAAQAGCVVGARVELENWLTLAGLGAWAGVSLELLMLV